MSERVISTSMQEGGYPCFVPERIPTADLGAKHEGARPKISHGARRDHIKAGNARFDAPAKESR